MCNLLGLNFSHPVDTTLSLDLFQLHGENNPDGWGVAYYIDHHLQVIKEPIPSVKSALFDFVESYPRTCTLISHVRRSTRGGRRYANTHPFYREVRIDDSTSEYAFAHNGTLRNLSSVTLDSHQPVGNTDSEQAFCHILDSIQKKRIITWNRDAFGLIETLLRRINSEDNTFNCIFSNANLLFCYSDENDHNAGLRFLPLSEASESFELRDNENRYGEVEFIPSSTEDNIVSEKRGVLVSTRQLGNHEWNEFNEGELIVFQNGHVVYPSTRKE
jgi:predicted glutamine amidotransferase